MLTFLQGYITQLGIHSALASYSISAAIVFTLMLVLRIIDLVTGRYLVQLVRAVLQRAHSGIEKLVGQYKLVRKVTRMAPAIWLFLTANGLVVEGLPASASFAYGFKLLLTLYMIVQLCAILDAFLHVGEAHYNRLEVSRKTPIKSYLQVVRVIIFIIAAILSIATILDKSPVALFTAFGAATGVLLFVFKDSILGFVTSIQLASFDMIRIGDWVAMPSFGADGNVIEISLTTVKIRNFDKTVTTIPTYALLSNESKLERHDGVRWT